MNANITREKLEKLVEDRRKFLHAIITELAPIASLGADDDGMEMAEYYASHWVNYRKSIHENVEFISQIISEDQ